MCVCDIIINLKKIYKIGWWLLISASLYGQFENRLFQSITVGAGEFFNLLLVLDEHKGGHAGDAIFHGNILAVVDINLEKGKVKKMKKFNMFLIQLHVA